MIDFGDEQQGTLALYFHNRGNPLQLALPRYLQNVPASLSVRRLGVAHSLRGRPELTH